jgi:phospholipid/cholesterol/gamma-HCH transport system substrate-binding protein
MYRRFTETLVGIFIIVSIVVFVMLYAWLSGSVGFRNTTGIVVYFNDVTGLRVGDPVMIYGLEKGKVKSLKIEQGKVMTVLAIEREIMIPEDSDISIRSLSLMGGDRYVRIVPGNATTVASVYYGYNTNFDLESLAMQFDSLLILIKDIELPDFNKIAAEFSRKLDKATQQLSNMFEGPSEKIEDLVIRLDSLSLQFKGNGTVGKLLKSDELYEEVRETNQALKELITDIKENPKKYINIKVF